MNTSMDEVFSFVQENPTQPVSVYEELAPLYQFMHEQSLEDYDSQFEVVSQFSQPSDRKVLDAACGPGYLTELLEENFEYVVGVDLSEEMVRLARSNTDSKILRDDILSVELEEEFDIITVFGESVAHFDEKHILLSFFENMYDHLSESGRLLFDYMHAHEVINGMIVKETFEDTRFCVTQTAVITVEGGQDVRISYGYELEDKEEGEKAITGGNMLVHTFLPEELSEVAMEAGFKEAYAVESSKDTIRSFVAKK